MEFEAELHVAPPFVGAERSVVSFVKFQTQTLPRCSGKKVARFTAGHRVSRASGEGRRDPARDLVDQRYHQTSEPSIAIARVT
jgi:hypothetical protein